MLKKLELIFRKFFPKRLPNYRMYQSLISGKVGLEVGGPSGGFTKNGFLPIYDVARKVDGCNFSSNTVWEGNITEGHHYRYGNKVGHQFIADASDLSIISNEQYDFILSSHSLEHIANPIKALNDWKRVLRSDGYLILILPHKDLTFDRKRPVTKLDHLISDFDNNTPETDDTHFAEAIQLHDIALDAGVTDIDFFKSRISDNVNNRCLHHHIFNTPLVASLSNYLNFKIVDLQTFSGLNIVALLQKTDQAGAHNQKFLNRDSPLFKSERHPSDQIWS